MDGLSSWKCTQLVRRVDSDSGLLPSAGCAFPDLPIGVLARHHVEIVDMESDDLQVPVGLGKAALENSFQIKDTPATPRVVIDVKSGQALAP